MSSRQFNSKNNGLILLLKTILKLFGVLELLPLSSVAKDGKDGKIGAIFSSFFFDDFFKNQQENKIIIIMKWLALPGKIHLISASS